MLKKLKDKIAIALTIAICAITFGFAGANEANAQSLELKIKLRLVKAYTLIPGMPGKFLIPGLNIYEYDTFEVTVTDFCDGTSSLEIPGFDTISGRTSEDNFGESNFEFGGFKIKVTQGNDMTLSSDTINAEFQSVSVTVPDPIVDEINKFKEQCGILY